MRYALSACMLAAALAAQVHAHGLLIPEDKTLPPLAMVNHRVTISIEEQVAITTIEQVFRNHTDRRLEATYIFPIPKGASVNKFSMTVNGKDQSAELIKSDDARKVYTDIVRRTQDPGLLEYIGNNLMRLRVFPIEPKVDQKITLSFNAVIPAEGGVVEYVYPLKTDGKATRTLEEFSIKAKIKSQSKVQNIYSPTHAIGIKKINDNESEVVFERNQALLDKDFQLFFSTGHKEVGLTPMFYRPISSENGYFLMLISPDMAASKSTEIPRDIVLVLDTSGSMAGIKMDQAKKALKYCLSNLNPQDRFAVINFSTTVNRYRDNLESVSSEQIEHAKKWVDDLKAAGGTAIQDALDSALEFRSKDDSRTFQVVFFTDGEPTVGERSPDKILKNVAQKNQANTRIFTFGVGDDVNATLLDQLADQTRAVSTYVRPAEDIEVKASSLYTKISHPVLANLRLTTSDNIRLEEVYPPNLPDLFHGGQLVVLGRYSGQGAASIKLSGVMGKETRDFVYETTFQPKTGEERDFVEQIWARRKVGYLLDQIRLNGESKELMTELLSLAKKYGIATPYTSHLIVPDAAMPVAGASPMGGRPGPRPAFPATGTTGVAGGGFGGPGFGGIGGGGLGGFGGGLGGMPAPGLAPKDPNQKPKTVAEFLRENQPAQDGIAKSRGGYVEDELKKGAKALEKDAGKNAEARRVLQALEQARDQKEAYDKAKKMFESKEWRGTQAGKLGVDLSVANNNLRSQDRLSQTASINCNGRQCMELGGVWIDEKYDPKMKCVKVKAQSDAYFRILDKQPKMKDVFRLGNYLVWVAPSNMALIVDTSEGKDKLTDAEIDELFAVKK